MARMSARRSRGAISEVQLELEEDSCIIQSLMVEVRVRVFSTKVMEKINKGEGILFIYLYLQAFSIFLFIYLCRLTLFVYDFFCNLGFLVEVCSLGKRAYGHLFLSICYFGVCGYAGMRVCVKRS